MRALGIICIGAVCLLASCACDCNDKLGGTNTDADSTNGIYRSGNMGTDGNNGGVTETNSSSNSGTNATGSAAGNTNNSGTGNTTGNNNSSTTNSTANDPRTYNQSGGGMGYRTDTIKEYDGIDGSARDKSQPTKKTTSSK